MLKVQRKIMQMMVLALVLFFLAPNLASADENDEKFCINIINTFYGHKKLVNGNIDAIPRDLTRMMIECLTDTNQKKLPEELQQLMKTSDRVAPHVQWRHKKTVIDQQLKKAAMSILRTWGDDFEMAFVSLGVIAKDDRKPGKHGAKFLQGKAIRITFFLQKRSGGYAKVKASVAKYLKKKYPAVKHEFSGRYLYLYK